jgi:hypothetical protein
MGGVQVVVVVAPIGFAAAGDRSAGLAAVLFLARDACHDRDLRHLRI